MATEVKAPWGTPQPQQQKVHATRLEHVQATRRVRDFGVADGTRTRDTQDHNLVLYQLNYSHHRCVKATRYRLTHAA